MIKTSMAFRTHTLEYGQSFPFLAVFGLLHRHKHMSSYSGVMVLGMRESMLSGKSLEVSSQDHHCGEGLHVATDCEQVPIAFRETYGMLQ